jgi:hypothetical protein
LTEVAVAAWILPHSVSLWFLKIDLLEQYEQDT